MIGLFHGRENRSLQKKKKNTKEVEVVEVLIESVRTTRFLWEF